MTYVAPTWDSATNRNVTVDEMNALAQAAAAAAGDSDAGVTALLDNTSSTTYAKVQEIAAASGGATDANVAPILQDTASNSYAAVESAVDTHLGGDATGLVTEVVRKTDLGVYATTHGAAGDGVTDNHSAFAAADAAALSTSAPIVVLDGTYRVASNLTITSPVTLSGTARIKPDSGVTVTLAGGIDAPFQQVFDHSAGGVVAPQNVAFYHPAWWGPVGSTDDSQTWKDMALALTAGADPVHSWFAPSQRVMAPTGTNRIMGVTLDHCEIFADKGTCYFTPPDSATTGTMLTIGDYVTLHGGYFEATGSQAVTILSITGMRSQIDNPYVSVRAAGATGISLGVGPGATKSPRLSHAKIYGYLPSDGGYLAGTTGLINNSSDSSIIDLWIGGCETGVQWAVGTGVSAVDVHVFDCGTGMTGSPDSLRGVSWYLDRCYGWGIDFSGCDNTILSAVHAISNGISVAGTGGIRMTKGSGSAYGCRLTDVVLDDNPGTGLLLDGVSSYTASVVVASTSARGGGAAAGTTGVNITSTASLADISVTGDPKNVTGSVLTDAGSSTVRLGQIRRTVTSDVTWTSTTSNQVPMPIPAGGNQTWLIEGTLIVDGPNSLRTRLQGTDLTPTGWFALGSTGTPVPVKSSAGLYSTVSLAGSTMMLQVRGTISTGAATSTSSSLDLQISPDQSNSSTTTLHAGSWITATRIS